MSKVEINIPVTILTGFLGAGKTTFLNHLLSTNNNKRFAIIENEFGSQGIDNELIIRPDETIVELNSGCLCCTLNDNLYDILNELYDRRDDFDEIIIEATGVADPAGLAQPFISHPLVKKHFPLKSIICLIDAEQIEDHLEETKEAIPQITFSDILLINKIDLINRDYLHQLTNMLQSLNPLAKIFEGDKDNFPPIDFSRNDEILEKTLLSFTENSIEPSPMDVFPITKPHSHHHHDHTEGINNQTFVFDKAFNLRRLQMQMSVYLTIQSKGLYRIKGLIWLEGEDHQFVMQSVGKRFDLTAKRKWELGEEKKNILVFIGKRLQRKGLERILTNCLVQENQKLYSL